MFYQSPLYPYLLAITFGVFGENLGAVRLLQSGLGLLLVLVIYLLGRQLFGVREGLIAAGLTALYGPLLNYNLLLLKVAPLLLLLGLFLLAGSKLIANPRRWWNWLLLGVICSLAMLLRDNLQIFLVAVPLWILVRFRAEPWRFRLAAAALFLAGAGLIAGPLLVRNRVVARQWVLSTSQGGANFFIGNNPIADGRYKTLPFVRPHPETEQQDFRAEAEKRAGRPLDPTEISGFWYDQGLRFIRGHPRQWLGLQWKKFRYFFGDHEIPDNHGFTFDRAHFLKALYFSPLSFGILLPLAVLGFIFTLGQRSKLDFLYLFVGLYTISILAFFVVGRYRIPIVVALIPLAAAGLARTWDMARRGSWGDLAGVSMVGLAVAAFAFFPTEGSRSSWATEYYLLGNAYLKDADLQIEQGEVERGRATAETALGHLEHSLELRPRNANALQSVRYAYRLLDREPPLPPLEEHLRAAGARAAEGRFDEAARILERAAEAYPGEASLRLQLGVALASREEIRDLDRATLHLRHALELDPELADAWNALGNIAFLRGDLQTARSHFMRALSLQPESESFRRNLALTYQAEADGAKVGD